MSLLSTKADTPSILGPYNTANDDQHVLVNVTTGSQNITDDLEPFQGAFVTVQTTVQVFIGIDANVGSSGASRGYEIPESGSQRFYIPEGKHGWRVRGAGTGEMHIYRTSL